ncbi:HD domain-containing protein [uncultured Parabacteroides sp.]|jgi:(p)ppGpp synthase/HD superfamily hydrolase|uniref:HD domain-containing protein n=1 Tax=uncultured Parabacteroides sp. TaxID=512312 RepID=UPI0025D55E7B|nr:HD domain-containing protein [uncultured Parabacteroides sp.]
MEKQSFVAIVKRYYPWICCMEKAAFRIHEDVNQKYNHVLPYGFHLKMTASYVSRYGYLTADSEADVLILYAAAYLHDTIEDARMTYNDVVKFIRNFREGDLALPEDLLRQVEEQVPDIVYALTNEKGRNRKERADERYYKGIRETKFASFIKMCDRLANIQYTVMFVFANHMLDVYRREYPDFIRSIGDGAVTEVPEAMKAEAERLLTTETYIL